MEDTGHRPSCFKLKRKASFSNFLRLFNESILKQQHAQNPAENAKKDVLELLALQKCFSSRNMVWAKLRKLLDLI